MRYAATMGSTDRGASRVGFLGAVAFAAAVSATPLIATSVAAQLGDGQAQGSVPLFSSIDVPKPIPDNDANGVTSTLVVHGIGSLADVNLVLDDVTHTCVSDLHVELTSPAGTTVVIIAASTENGILMGVPCPHNFIGAVLDDQSPVGLRFTGPPYTNRMNVAHASVGDRPLSTFNGESGDGTWTLRISDRNADDTGTLNGWSLEVTPTAGGDFFASTDVPKAIPESDPTGVASRLEIPVRGTIEDLDVILNSILHTCVADLQIALTSPAGTTVVLIISSADADGILSGAGCPRDFVSTYLSDQAPVNLTRGTAPYSGYFNIEDTTVVPMPLSHFNGESIRGVWTLQVSDRGNARDTGTLNAWSLHPRLSPPPPCDGDFNQSETVTVDELVTAVNNALKGCPGQDGRAASTGVTDAVHSFDVPKAIPDNDANGVTSTLNLLDVGVIGDVNLLLDDITHPCDPDLHIELTSPAGTTAVVVASSIENGILARLSCPQNFTATVLDDQAAVNLRDGSPPYTGSFNGGHESVGVSPLSAFNGENADGTWTLRISDRNADDTGSLNAWGLAFSPPVPEAISSMDVPKTIPDHDDNGVTSVINLSASGAIEDVDLILDSVTHPCLEDLHIELTSPAGTTVVLIKSSNDEANGILYGTHCPDNFRNTILSDQSPVNLADGFAPYTGTFNIERPGTAGTVPMPLSQFNGESADGTWTLRISDLAPGYTGTLDAWSLRLKLAPVPPCNGDFNNSGNVTVDELVKAVNNALKGCP